jgi:prepilin-type processing-associated H-X9-DG protein
MGDPDRGTGPGQPGGWIYQVVPFMEQANVTYVGKGMRGTPKYEALAQQRAAVVGSFYCPSRRAPGLIGTSQDSMEESFNSGKPPLGDAKSDYAANGGANKMATQSGPVPNGDFTDCTGGFPSCAGYGWSPNDAQLVGASNPAFVGIVTARAGAAIRQVTDGTSNTIMVGEKFLPPNFYASQTEEGKTGGSAADDNPGDNSCMYLGHDLDTVRWPNGSFDDDGQPQGNLPVRDTHPVPGFYKNSGAWRMGSPHTGGVNLVYVDGSVHTVEFDVDPLVWNGLGNREDGG